MADRTPDRSTVDRLLLVADRFAAEGRLGMAELARKAALQGRPRPVTAPMRPWPFSPVRPRPDDLDAR